MSKSDTIPLEDIEKMRSMKRNGATVREIEKETGWSNSAVSRHTKDVVKKWKDENWLRERRRVRCMDCREIAKEVPVGEATISKWCNKLGIVPEHQDEQKARELYVEQKLSTIDLAERWEMTHSAARRALIILGIDRREPLHNGGNSDKISGAAAYGEKWSKKRRAALIRDQFTCQHDGCSENGPRLDVHHITPVSEFDDYEDAHYLDNLVALCRSHHKEAENNICPSTHGK